MNRTLTTLAVGLAFLTGGLLFTQIATADGGSTADIPILGASGLGSSRFGQNRAAVTAEVAHIFLRRPAEQNLTTDCGVDSEALWPGLAVYFFRGRFVGYRVSGDSSLSTRPGLVVGDGVDRAAQLYPHRFHVSEAQGGAWSVSDSAGSIGGFLSSARIHDPSTEITSIEAGQLGCAAARY